MLTENEELYVQWVRDNSPAVYKRAMLQASDRTNTGLGAVPSLTRANLPYSAAIVPNQKSWFSNFTDSIKQIAPALVQYKNQKKIMRMQLRRAEQGLPPLDTSALAPTIRIQPELSPEMYDNMKRYVIPFGVGIGALLIGLLLSRKKR